MCHITSIFYLVIIMEFISLVRKRLLNIRYLIVLLVFLILVYNSLFQELSENIGLSTFFIRTASEISFLQNTLTRHYVNVLIITGPLLTMIACSGLYVDDCEANMLGPIFTRISKKKYHIYNIFTVFLLSFILIFLPLVIGYLISLISNPIYLAMDNASARPTFFIKEYGSSVLLQWEMFNPILFTFFHIFLTSVIFSIFAGLSYIISMVVSWSRYIPIITVFSFYIVYNILCIKSGYAEMSFFNLIDPYADKLSIGFIFMLIGIFIIAIIVLFKIALKKGE